MRQEGVVTYMNCQFYFIFLYIAASEAQKILVGMVGLPDGIGVMKKVGHFVGHLFFLLVF